MSLGHRIMKDAIAMHTAAIAVMITRTVALFSWKISKMIGPNAAVAMVIAPNMPRISPTCLVPKYLGNAASA